MKVLKALIATAVGIAAVVIGGILWLLVTALQILAIPVLLVILVACAFYWEFLDVPEEKRRNSWIRRSIRPKSPNEFWKQ